MHVLHVTPYFPPTWAYGGIPRIVYGLGKAQVHAGLRVSVWTTDALDARQRATVAPVRDFEGMEVHTSRNASNTLAYRHQFFAPQGARGLLDGLRDVDLVHLHGHRHLLNNWALSFARERKLPVVFTPNGTLPRYERKVGFKWIWDQLLAGRVPRHADRCVAVAPAEVGHMLAAGIPSERIARIPNGLVLEEFDALPARGEFKAAWGIEGPVVAFLGQVSPRKGVDHLAMAFRDGALGDATLVVGGNDMGGMKAAQKSADSSVVFTGLLEGGDRLALLVDAEVLVYPSSDEIFGLVPFEGLMCGTPAVVGGDCGCGQLIQEAGAGLLVSHADIEGLRARIRSLLQDEVASRAMVTRGRKYVRERLSFESVARKHVELYSELARQPRRRGGERGREAS